MAEVNRASDDPCPCGSEKPYQACCEPYHQGRPAPTPETLMRSRYAAYALDKVDYIIKTTHPDSPHRRSNRDQWRAELVSFCEQTAFIKLNVLSVEEGDSRDTGYVTFRAVLLQGTHDVSFAERSQFKRLHKRWLYLDGVTR